MKIYVRIRALSSNKHEMSRKLGGVWGRSVLTLGNVCIPWVCPGYADEGYSGEAKKHIYFYIQIAFIEENLFLEKDIKTTPTLPTL